MDALRKNNPTAVYVLFLDKEGFPTGEMLTTQLPLNVLFPKNAHSARIEFEVDGFIMVRILSQKLDGKTAECIPQNSIGIYDGDLFVNGTPRYMLYEAHVASIANTNQRKVHDANSSNQQHNDDDRCLMLDANIEVLTPEQACHARISAMSVYKSETDIQQIEILKMQTNFSDSYESKTWRIVRVYYSFKDLLKSMLFATPSLKKPLLAMASIIGLRQRSKPIQPKEERLLEAERLYRPNDRQQFELSQLPVAPIGKLTVAVHLHLYYIDLLEYFNNWLSHIPVPFDLYVSVVDSTHIEHVRNGFTACEYLRQVTIEVVENRGRDVAPMVNTFGAQLSDYDVFLHIHSKKSSHNSALKDWREMLMKNLLADREHILRLLGLFVEHPSLGILYPDPVEDFPYWTLTNQSNFHDMQSLLSKIGVPFSASEKYIDFPVGTMFWARGHALASLLTAPTQDFPDESGQLDGTLAHAVERSLCLIAASAGYSPAQVDTNKNSVNIGVGLRNLQSYIATTSDDALKYLQSFKHISFDLFGTLLVSDYLSDKDLWLNVANQFSKQDSSIKNLDFPALRLQAELIVKNTCGAADIHNVYAELRKLTGLSVTQCERIKALEFEELFDSCRVRTVTSRLLNTLHQKGLDIVITEDSVWTKAYIKKLLVKCCGENSFELYISSELGYNKRTGAIFNHLKGRFCGQAFVHIGDDEILDMAKPNEHRIHTLHVMHPRDMAAVSGLSIDETDAYYSQLCDDPFCIQSIMRQKLEQSLLNQSHQPAEQSVR